MELERRQSDTLRRARDLEALLVEARQRETEHIARISELEGTLQQVARLQKQASAEKQQKEQDFRDEIARLQQVSCQAQAGGPEQAPRDAALTELRRREQEHLDKIGDLSKQVSELQKAPLIIQSLLTEAAKKDEERKQEISRLKVALLQHPAVAQDPPDSRSESDGPARQRGSASSAEALEAEVDRLRGQLKSRDRELQDVMANYERCRHELEARRLRSAERLLKRDGSKRRAASPEPLGSPVMNEWRRQLALFNPAGVKGDLAQAQFRRLLELDLEVAARVERRPELLATVQAARAAKAEQLRREAQCAVVERKATASPPRWAPADGASPPPPADGALPSRSGAGGLRTPGHATPQSPGSPLGGSPASQRRWGAEQATDQPFAVGAFAPPRFDFGPVGDVPMHEALRWASPAPCAAGPRAGEALQHAAPQPRRGGLPTGRAARREGAWRPPLASRT
ncbi:unnamed protein product [Prorocentrum cordatum]|uniref:Centrosomal protein of 162 kDa n=1 Tax=Prorocentrum cordatum TaxID=2364126 RepID=A0ABN9VJ01_9DINO|nr:unnamed protein product [Polarella glacialis]